MKGIFLRLSICLFVCSFSLYSYLDKQNRCIELQMKLPKIVKDIEAVREENAHLAYQIECFENPSNLLGMAVKPEFAHLKFPALPEILTVREGLALRVDGSEEERVPTAKARTPIVVGAHP